MMNYWKKSILALFTLIYAANVSGQQSTGFNLALYVCVSDEGVKVSPSSKSLLESKLLDLVTASGMSGYKGGRFFVAPKVTVINQQTLAGPPSKIVADVSITFFVGDNSDQKVIHSYYKEFKGMGPTKDQAIMNAVRNLNSRDKELANFVQESRTRIVELYSRNCEAIIAGAQSQSIQNIAGAIEDLSMIPMENTECYKEAQIQLQLLYANYIHRRCSEAISKARATWSASYNLESANRAVASLDRCFLDEDCQKDLNKLSEEMRSRVEKNEEFDRALTNLLIESENKKMELDAEILKEIIRSQPTQVYNTEFIFVD
jgi:hypothetical protein